MFLSRHQLSARLDLENGLSDFDPPHDISGRPIAEYLPKGSQSEILLEMMQKSSRILTDHPVNQARIKQGHRPANSIWLWGQGKKPALAAFKDRYGLNGSVVCAVDLIKGLGLCAGLRAVAVPGATGGTVTNMRGKAEASLKELQQGRILSTCTLKRRTRPATGRFGLEG